MHYPLPDLLLEPIVRAGLLEDLGRAGDITTDAIVPPDAIAAAALRSRQDGVVAGLDMVRLSFKLIDPTVTVAMLARDGDRVAPGDTVARIEGSARGVLTGERVGLNLLSHLSGIATATASIAQAIAGSKAKLCCTRKTTPGMRALQKYAVRVGGGSNHRFGLDDAVLIKDNHIAIAGSVGAAIDRVRSNVGHLVKVEVEVDTLAQLAEALATGGVDAALLDNMSCDTLREAVNMINGRAIAEASGGITPETAPGIAATGVDLISVGWLTHSVRAMDFGLDFDA
ncbi:nicotinate-nucleotide pyrophosphorylase [Acetobacter nitrogenifigens DSM 23921 = NBRC 105050]|uniref:Probable nicotinate-nucleotide pyrophosphorylase [carboxylating] n=1 Tax=Acetobacter nitrogenifigens DSM 23921 = NBRC 105050 TaxID=1120919 RepID=A0A511X6H3_9PROT|nr:carboxylating nicotinate-nucleotide diphosphorylase [Acetobacter nitrogenifigens]GBQ94515.1 nicotinate-nucleotide pyrophosphorylase [Acetobacter nitrogenifigens DSM 23921 = NBRC 105050]GEN58544.1 nicotinate-nucleotide diphosphorylase (carboxylating) [Acetobacter nitrogenifigens DSM 23921 = NBRC 105050]